MYNHNNRQFLLRQSNNNVWNIFYNPNGELQYSRLRGQTTFWSEPVTIVKSASPFFYALFGPQNEVIVLYQTVVGDIFLINLEQPNSDPFPILKGKNSSDYNKHISALYINGRLYIYFVIKHNDKALLACQTFNVDTVSSPSTIDFIEYNDLPYYVTKDEDNNIFVFYPSFDGIYLQIGYKRFNPSSNMYSDFVTVTRGEGNSIYPRVIVDNNNIFHMCFQKTFDRQNQLLYTQKIPGRNIWSEEIRIHASTQSFLDSSLAFISNVLYIFRVLNDQIYYVFSVDNGKVFSKYCRYNFTCPKQLVCVIYSSTGPFREKVIVSDELPCCFINSFKLAFVKIQDPPVTATNVSNLDFKNLILDTHKSFKSALEKNEENNDKNTDNINKLSGALVSTQRDLDKATLRIQALESELRSVNEMESNLNYIKKVLSRNELQELQDVDSILNQGLDVV